MREFIGQLNAKSGQTRYRLPTEVVGNELVLYGNAWFVENNGGRTHPVGLLEPNGWRQLDMLGNEYEWMGLSGMGIIQVGAVTDPVGPRLGSVRVLERTPETWFKRYNGKNPAGGGARKSTATRPQEWLEDTRESWAEHANRALERAGSTERIDDRSHEDRFWDAVEAGDEREAERLEQKMPGVHVGPTSKAMERSGRPAAASRNA